MRKKKRKEKVSWCKRGRDLAVKLLPVAELVYSRYIAHHLSALEVCHRPALWWCPSSMADHHCRALGRGHPRRGTPTRESLLKLQCFQKIIRPMTKYMCFPFPAGLFVRLRMWIFDLDRFRLHSNECVARIICFSEACRLHRFNGIYCLDKIPLRTHMTCFDWQIKKSGFSAGVAMICGECLPSRWHQQDWNF